MNLRFSCQFSRPLTGAKPFAAKLFCSPKCVVGVGIKIGVEMLYRFRPARCLRGVCPAVLLKLDAETAACWDGRFRTALGGSSWYFCIFTTSSARAGMCGYPGLRKMVVGHFSLRTSSVLHISTNRYNIRKLVYIGFHRFRSNKH